VLVLVQITVVNCVCVVGVGVCSGDVSAVVDVVVDVVDVAVVGCVVSLLFKNSKNYL